MHRQFATAEPARQTLLGAMRYGSNRLRTMKPETIARLPKAHIVLEEKPDGSLVAAPWSTGWETEDIDADGFPGATVQISGTSCSGDVYVSSHTLTALLSGHATDDGATGEVSLRLKQKILGAKGLCLKLMAGDSDETQTGAFAYPFHPIRRRRRIYQAPEDCHPRFGSARGRDGHDRPSLSTFRHRCRESGHSGRDGCRACVCQDRAEAPEHVA
jgi:hypothetical protein